MSKQENAGAAWKRTVKLKSGGEVEVLDVTMADGSRFTMWPNYFKKPGEKSPDYRLQVNDYKPQNKQNEPAAVFQPTVHPGTEDDLPF